MLKQNRSGVPVVIRTLYTPTLRVGDRGGKNKRQEYPQTPSSSYGEIGHKKGRLPKGPPRHVSNTMALLHRDAGFVDLSHSRCMERVNVPFGGTPHRLSHRLALKAAFADDI